MSDVREEHQDMTQAGAPPMIEITGLTKSLSREFGPKGINLQKLVTSVGNLTFKLCRQVHGGIV